MSKQSSALGSSILIFSILVTNSLSVSMFLVYPSILDVQSKRTLPRLNSCFNIEEAPYREPCLSNSLSIDSISKIAFLFSFTSFNIFLKRSSTSPLYEASAPRAAKSTS